MEDCCTNKGGKMETNKIILWVVIGVLAVAVLYFTFTSGASSAGYTAPAQAAASSGGMVGGC